MINSKQEILNNIQQYKELMAMDKATEEILEELDTQWSYNPFNGCYIFKTLEGCLCIPTEFDNGIGEYLVLDKAYIERNKDIEQSLF
ncbi:hypothetical protein [Clostridium magnum]|uniref:Uncharacterized protein n=1 Tax=Clostridium magnum DSM 2767 TaxID=1121326 RepID=A0A162RWH2_9CLOT|nr:hypothetical protein [Clostridium magnum]KZL90467.1 hypothetical protein CLMAG_42380 [Clostridium magnum DSM 2767]SHH85942.1 hypothetical protein SAMN02745944_01615 [Clostridium magnum DSM 2767]